MDTSVNFKGWAELRPTVENGSLVSFVFPLDSPARYEIGSRNAESLSLLVPEAESETGEKSMPIEAVLVVNEEGEVLLERPDGQNCPVLVNDLAIEAGRMFHAPVSRHPIVTFGTWSFRLFPLKGILDQQGLSKMFEVRRCHVCKTIQESVYILACGHSICAKCRREGMAQTSPSGIGQAPQAAQVVPPAVNVQQAGPAQQGQARIEIPQLPPMHCSPCRSRVTVGVATASISSVTLNQAGKLASDFDLVDGHRPLCDDCQNKRGLVGVRDYNFCEPCQRMLCPLCVLQWHRSHKLLPQLERMRNLDSVEQNLARVAQSFAVVDQQFKELSSDKEIIKILDHGHRAGKAMKESMRELNQKVLQCQLQLNFVRQRKRALGRGWDETSQEMVAAFDRLVKEVRELKQYVEKLRDGDQSLTVSLSTSSDETTGTKPKPSPSPSPSPSPRPSAPKTQSGSTAKTGVCTTT